MPTHTHRPSLVSVARLALFGTLVGIVALPGPTSAVSSAADRACAVATVKYAAEMRYDEGKKALVATYQDAQGKVLEKLHIAPGDRVTVLVEGAESVHALETWKARFRWEEKDGKTVHENYRWVKLSKKGTLDKGVALTCKLEPSVPVSDAGAKALQHQFSRTTAEKKFGVINQACEVVLVGVVDLTEPKNSEFPKPHRSAKVVEGPVRESGAEGTPDGGVWYTVRFEIERVEANSSED